MDPASESELSKIVKKVVRRTLQTGTASPPPGPRLEGFLPPAGTSPSPEGTLEQAAHSQAVPARTIALGADHGGYQLKMVLKGYLEEQGYQIIDCGTHSSESVDYPDFALAVANLVGEKKVWRGIMIDGAGIGSCMVANKVSGVRAAMCYDYATANNSREHNDANLLTLGAGLIGENLARQIVHTWLTTPFAGGRHARRVNKIIALDEPSRK